MPAIKNLIYGTNPIIFHAQGDYKDSPLWQKINNLCVNKITLPKELEIVTFNSNNTNHKKNIGTLEKSIQNQCFVLGKDIKKWQNFFKIFLIIDFLELSKAKYIAVLDSYDIVVYSLEEILEKFLQKKCKILFNAEVHCYPPNYGDEEKWFRKPFCYLNAGACLGEREHLLKFYEECSKLIKKNDYRPEQEYIKRNYYFWYPEALIDDDCSIFQTLNGVNENILDVK